MQSAHQLTWYSDVFNGTFSTYDPRTNKVIRVTPIPGIFGNLEFHTSGIQVDSKRDLLYIIAGPGAVWETSGKDISGDSFLIQYDLAAQKFNYFSNLTSVANGLYSGHQDIAQDCFGNSYVVGSYPSSILKVSKDGKTITPWYVESGTATTVHGYSGIASSANGRFIIVSDSEKGQLLRFDTEAPKGIPIHIPLQAGAEPIGESLDGGYLPALFHDTVFLATDNVLGTVVIQSKDGWKSAQKVGVIPNTLASAKGTPTATVEIRGRIYVVTDFFGDATRNRTDFPLIDITDKIKNFLH